jgi:hypothetical protein
MKIPLSCLTLCFVFTLLNAGSSRKEYFGPEVDVKCQKALDDLGEEVSDRFKMQFLVSGYNDLLNNGKICFALSLASPEKLNIDETRKLSLNLFNYLFERYKSDPAFYNYYREDALSYKMSTEVAPNVVSFKIAFWDYDVNRYYFPNIAQVTLLNQKLYYYYADPKTQILQEPIVETLDEARNRISDSKTSQNL